MPTWVIPRYMRLPFWSWHHTTLTSTCNLHPTDQRLSLTSPTHPNDHCVSLTSCVCPLSVTDINYTSKWPLCVTDIMCMSTVCHWHHVYIDCAISNMIPALSTCSKLILTVTLAASYKHQHWTVALYSMMKSGSASACYCSLQRTAQSVRRPTDRPTHQSINQSINVFS